MSDTATRDERRSALDEFATRTMPESTAMATITSGPPAEYIHGAQAVAVHRDERMVLNRIRELAAAAGQDWYFRFPVKSKGSTEWIEGPSIQLALDVARIYGNAEIDCRAQDLGSVILFHARFHDVETGFSLTRPFQQRKGQSRMGGDAGRRDDIDFQIGASKAIRNVIVNALRTYTNFAFEEAKEALVDKIGSQIDRYRRTTVERIEKMVPLDRVEAVIGRKAAEWLAPDIARVIAMGKAINDGMASVNETFPPLGHDVNTGEILDTFASSGSVPPTAAGEAAASPLHPLKDDAAATSKHRAEVEPGPGSVPVNPLKAELVDGILKVADDSKINPNQQDRLEGLEIAKEMLTQRYPEHADFVDKAARIASKVVTENLKIADARKYMSALGWEETL